MGINSYISNSKKWPWAFVASLVIFTMLQMGLARSPAFWRCVEHNCRFHFDDALRLEAVLHRIPKNAPFKKVLLIGTSQGREGIDVPTLNDHFKDRGIRFYDLGVIGNFHPIDLHMLKDRILATNPDVIVYSPHVETFYAPYKLQPANNLEYYFNPNIIPYLVKHLRWEDYDKEFRGDLMDSFIGSFSLFYRFRNHFGPVFMASLKYGLTSQVRPAPEVTFFTEPYSDSYFSRVIQKRQKEPRYRYTRYTELYQELFTLFVDDVTSRDIEFIVLNCPLHPLFPKAAPANILNDYYTFLTEQSSKKNFVYTSNKELPYFGAEEFNDFTHLTLSGRERFTKYLMGYFEERFKDLNWIEI